MFILGLQGSPRKGGNTDSLLAAFMQKADQAGAIVKTIQVSRAGIVPCIGCGYCESHGSCVFGDDPMSTEMYGLLKAADVIVVASPVFFYGVPSQLKSLIDRSQTLWSRKYVYKLRDPLAATRKGVLLSVGASKGRQLFDGIQLTARYFFDAIDADFSHALTYRGIEAKGVIRKQKGLAADIKTAIEKTVRPLLDRKEILFVSKQGACRSPMAAAIAQQRHGQHIRTGFGAVSPASELSAVMVRTMEAMGVDMGFRKPSTIEQALFGASPDLVVVIGDGVDRLPFDSVKTIQWDLPQPPPTDDHDMDRLRSEISARVDTLMQSLQLRPS
jgi:arsenite transporter/arsenate reductase (thioredoxin)